VTREGQVIFFAQFLHFGGRWERLPHNSPLRYHGNRGSGAVNVLGTASLSILRGHWLYAHINSVRGDTLNPPLLGMTHAVSEDVVRRAMKRMDERAGLALPHPKTRPLPAHAPRIRRLYERLSFPSTFLA